jgi:hypothetical protein
MPLDINTNIITGSTVKMFNDTTPLTTGLTYLFDAGLGNSYPGSGTSWFEWVANTTTATLTNGPTPSNDGGGSILLDGSNDFVEVPTRTINAPWTLQMWIKPNGTGGGLHSHWSGGPVGHGWFLDLNKLAFAYYNGDWRYVYDTGITVPTGVWTNVAVSLTGSNPLYFWVNGQLSSTKTVTGGVYGLPWGSLGMLWGWNNFNGYIAQSLNYSGTDIGQSGIYNNYQVTRTRFGV